MIGAFDFITYFFSKANRLSWYYYLNHFIKNYKENNFIEISLVKKQTVNVLYNENTVFLFEKENKII